MRYIFRKQHQPPYLDSLFKSLYFALLAPSLFLNILSKGRPFRADKGKWERNISLAFSFALSRNQGPLEKDIEKQIRGKSS